MTETETAKKLYGRLELIWWVVTAVVILLVLLPIYTNPVTYPFYLLNIVYIATLITATRHVFLLRYTFLANRTTIQFVLVFLMIPFIFYQVQGLNTFQTYIDEEGFDAIVGDLPYGQQVNMMAYIRNQMLLFGVGSIIASTLLPFRLLVDIWQNYKRRLKK